MGNEMHVVNVTGFQEFLVKHGYSRHVIPRYVRKVTEFGAHSDGCATPTLAYETLRKEISDYLANIPLSLQKETCQAALHLYYYFISGDRWKRRLHATDFEPNPSIEHEIARHGLSLYTKQRFLHFGHMSKSVINSGKTGSAAVFLG